MDFTGNICQGCQLPLKDTDDIVVCPECGTPQHRECYEKENKCVCSDKHAEDYTWKGEVKKAPVKEEAVERIACPNCGVDNPKGSTVCRNCGMKFTLFGMNVVDAIHNENMKNRNKNSDIPEYKPPFTLGVGEGFDKEEGNAESTPAQQVESLLTDILSGNGPENKRGDRLLLGGPFPVTDEIDGVMTNTIGNFIGNNALSYISKFKKLASGKKLSFNFAAFFFAPYWFFFRKLHKVGIFFMTAFLAISILAVPASMEMTELSAQIAAIIGDAQVLTDAQAEQLLALVEGSYEIMIPLMIVAFVNMLLHVIAGFVANPIYKKYVIENASKAEKMPTKKAAGAYIFKNGGASILYAFAAFFAQEFISFFVSYLL